jgi:SAM-dependent methyltransferase
MHWRLKGFVQKVLGHMPAGDTLHYLLQRRLGGLKNFPAEFASKVDDWRIMVGHLRDAGRPIAGGRFLEVGSGWYPTFPFACFLAGAERVTTVDLNRHLKVELTLGCAAMLADHVDTIATAAGVPVEEVRERQRRLVQTLDDRLDLTAASGGVIQYRAPADARATALPDGSIDCVFSNSVLEHVPGDTIEGIFRESKRVLVPRGIMFHSVNCGDHYAYVDRSISQLHYLRYSDAAWQLWQNEFLYQNRMRAQEFVQLAEQTGFTIALNTAHPVEKRLRELAQVPVHPQFGRFTPEQLCITTIDFIARSPAGSGGAAAAS